MSSASPVFVTSPPDPPGSAGFEPVEAAVEAADPDDEEVPTDVEGVTESHCGRMFNVRGDRLNGVEDARRVLGLIKPSHCEFNFESTFVGLGEDGVRCLLEGLRDRSRSTTGEWADFSVNTFFLHIVFGPEYDDRLEEEEEEDLFQAVSAWVRPLIFKILFDDPANFPHLCTLALTVHLPDDSTDAVCRLISDARLNEIWLAASTGSLSLLSSQLHAVLDRLTAQPRSLERIGLVGLAPGTMADDTLLGDIEDLVLDVVRTGQDGLCVLGILDEWLFDTEDRHDQLVAAAEENDWLGNLVMDNITIAGSHDEDNRAPQTLPGLAAHLQTNTLRNRARKDALLSIVVPARILSLAQDLSSSHATALGTADPSPAQVGSVVRQVTITSLPPEIISLILRSLADLIAVVYARHYASVNDPPFEPPSDVTVDPRGIQDMIDYASDLTTLHRERRKYWTDRLLLERRSMLASNKPAGSGARAGPRETSDGKLWHGDVTIR